MITWPRSPLLLTLPGLLASTIFAGSCGLATPAEHRDTARKDRSSADAKPANAEASTKASTKALATPGVRADGQVVVAFPFFEGTFEAALAAAKAESKLVLVDVGAYWCHSCHELEEEVFTLPSVGDFVRERFIAVKLDAEKDQGPELTERYRVQAYPTLLVLSADGVEMGRLVEVADDNTLLSGLTKIVKGGDPIAALASAAAAAPDDLQARYRLALAYALAARRDEADTAYKQVIAGDPDNKKGLASKALYEQAAFLVAKLDGDPEAAIAHYLDLQRRFPTSREATRSRRSVGRQLHKLGRSDQAIASLEAMVATNPKDVSLRASYGWFSFRERCQPTAGLHAVEAGIQAEPNNAELHYLRAELAHLVGDETKALTAMRTASKLEPKTAYYRRQLRRFEALAASDRGGA